MRKKELNVIPPEADRMGRFIGQLRVHEGITLNQLAHGLCTPSFLNRIENGEREVGKQLTDAFFQRLGKPVELFERILDWNEFQQWTCRQELIAHLHHGDIQSAWLGVQAYLRDDAEVLDQQFAKIIEINCRYLSGAQAEELLSMVRDALLLTQPTFLTVPVGTLLLSQNEGRLLFAYLQLKEQLEGYSAVADAYHALLCYFKKARYESRERVYLFPYVACCVIKNDYAEGHYLSALTVCEDALDELTREKRLFLYDRLLEWKQKLYDAIGNPDRTPEQLLAQLKLIQAQVPKQVELFIPIDERGHVYCLNKVIRDRRKLLGISQEALAEGICESRTLSRIENFGGSMHRKNRKLLLQRVNMSGERYDYEVISDRYEDYLLRSELDRAVTAGKTDESQQLLSHLRESIPNIPTNQQYIDIKDAKIRYSLPQDCPEKISLEELHERVAATIQYTLPLSLNEIDVWPTSSLSINEILSLISYAFYCKQLNQYEQSLAIVTYLKRCLQNAGTSVTFYEDLHTRIEGLVANSLGDLGQYQESNLLSYECVRMSLENQSSSQIVGNLYNIAWNLARQLSACPAGGKEELQQTAFSLLQQAYAAALITGNTVMKRHISDFCLKTYGEKIQL